MTTVQKVLVRRSLRMLTGLNRVDVRAAAYGADTTAPNATSRRGGSQHR